jgi:hypothetical protein
MTARAPAVLVAIAVAFGTIGATEVPIGGVTIGTAIAAIVHDNGFPSAVATTDAGNRFTFPAAIAYTNDDGIVVAAETASGTVTVEVDGKPKAFVIGDYTNAQADLELATVAEYAGDGVRTYRLSNERELVLLFDKQSKKLTRVTYGQRGQLARMGLISGDDTVKAVPYKAPQIRHTAIADGTGTRITIVKLNVGRTGDVKDVTVISPSGDAAFDANLPKALSTDVFIPATFGGRPIGSTVFRELRH